MAANELLIKINATAKGFNDEIDRVKKQTKDLQGVLDSVAKKSAAAFAGLTATVAAVTKVYADYETALVGVGKTTDLTGKDLDRLGKRIDGLSTKIPLATNELLGIAQAAGQLGVTGEENLVKFTDTIARLGVSTDLTGEQAATALTRILTVTGEGVENIDRFGSVIVRLGNNFAATESEIVRMANEVTRATAIFGVNATEAAALSTALKAVGVRAELGGSAVGRAFRAIDKAVRTGGKGLRELEALTGRTGDELKRVFEEDSVGAFQIFIESLGEVQRSGGDVTAELAKFGLKGEEILKVLPVLAKESGLVARALNTAKKEFEDNTALAAESEAAFATLNSQTTLLKNEVVAIARAIGAGLAPEITALVTNLKEGATAVKNFVVENKEGIATVLKWTTIITGAVAAVAALASGIIAAMGAFAVAKFAIAALGLSIGSLAGPIGIAIVAVGGLAFALNELFSDPGNEPKKSLEQLNQELDVAKKKQAELRKELETEPKGVGRRLSIIKKENDEIEKEIENLEKLRKQAIRTDEEFGTGSLLLRTNVQDDFDLSVPGAPDLPEQTIDAPLQDLTRERLAEEQKAEQEALEASKKREAEKAKLQKEAEEARLAGVKSSQAKILLEQDLFNKTQQDRFNEKENALLAKQNEFDLKKLEIADERRAASEIADEQEREIALQNVELKNQLLLDQERAFLEQAAEVRAEDRERKAALDEELRALELEQREALNQEDLNQLREKLLTEDEIDRKVARDRALRNIQARNQELEDRKKFGSTVATLNRFFNSEEVQGVKRTTSDLEQLRSSSSKKMQRIGKAAARVNAAIKTAEGAIAAYTSLAPIPIVGPALGAAAAAALLAFGVEQQRKIDAVGAQRGGIVQDVPTAGGLRDRVPALLEPGELVVPRALTPDFIQAVGRPEVTAEGSEAGSMSIEIGLRDEFLEFTEDGLQERRALNITNEGLQ